MPIKRIYNYITGYVNITIEGMFLERFINICIYKSIYLWNSKRKTATIMRANISILDFKKIKEIARKTRLPHKNKP